MTKKQSVVVAAFSHYALPAVEGVRHSLTNNAIISLRSLYNAGPLLRADINLRLYKPSARLHFNVGVRFCAAC